jgi:hypothetical protein
MLSSFYRSPYKKTCPQFAEFAVIIVVHLISLYSNFIVLKMFHIELDVKKIMLELEGTNVCKNKSKYRLIFIVFILFYFFIVCCLVVNRRGVMLLMNSSVYSIQKVLYYEYTAIFVALWKVIHEIQVLKIIDSSTKVILVYHVPMVPTTLKHFQCYCATHGRKYVQIVCNLLFIKFVTKTFQRCSELLNKRHQMLLMFV